MPQTPPVRRYALARSGIAKARPEEGVRRLRLVRAEAVAERDRARAGVAPAAPPTGHKCTVPRPGGSGRAGAVAARRGGGCAEGDEDEPSARVDELARARDRGVSSAARTAFRMRADTENEGRFTFRASMLVSEGSATGRLRGVLHTV